MGGAMGGGYFFTLEKLKSYSFSNSLAQPFHYRKSPFSDNFGGHGFGPTAAIEIYAKSIKKQLKIFN